MVRDGHVDAGAVKTMSVLSDIGDTAEESPYGVGILGKVPCRPWHIFLLAVSLSAFVDDARPTANVLRGRKVLFVLLTSPITVAS